MEDRTQQVITGPRLSPLVVLAAAEKLIAKLENHRPALESWGLDDLEIEETLDALRHALSRPELERKLKRELGNLDPARLVRFDFRTPTYEAWVPLGLLAHVTAGNAPAAGVLSAVEGLLSGNLNVIKAASDDPGFAAGVLAALADEDATGQIAARLIVLHFSSSRADWMSKVLGAADAVAVWGGEEAITGVTELVRPGTRVIDWGPKLSFAYLTSDHWCDVDTLHALAADVCQLEQQACSSPQVIYLDTEDPQQVFAFAERFASVLELTGPPTREPVTGRVGGDHEHRGRHAAGRAPRADRGAHRRALAGAGRHAVRVAHLAAVPDGVGEAAATQADHLGSAADASLPADRRPRRGTP